MPWEARVGIIGFSDNPISGGLPGGAFGCSRIISPSLRSALSLIPAALRNQHQAKAKAKPEAHSNALFILRYLCGPMAALGALAKQQRYRAEGSGTDRYLRTEKHHPVWNGSRGLACAGSSRRG
jgi:hypothetical protein